MILLLEKAFIHSTTYTTKKGKTVTRKAYTDKRIAKKVVAKDRINIPSIKSKSPKEVSEKLHSERDSLKAKLEEVRQHKADLVEAKAKGQTHTDKGIHVDHAHHIHKHEKNLHEKLETANHKLMLHENRYELQREKGEEAKKKRVTIRKEAQKKTESEKKPQSDKKPQEMTKEEFINSDKFKSGAIKITGMLDAVYNSATKQYSFKYNGISVPNDSYDPQGYDTKKLHAMSPGEFHDFIVNETGGKKTEAEKKQTRSQAMIGNKNAQKFGSHEEYSDWLRKQDEHVKETHKLDRIDGELTATWLPEKAEPAKREEKKVVVKKKEVSKIPPEWVGSGGGTMLINKDQVRGGIIDKVDGDDEWFAIPHDDNAKSPLDGFATREEAYAGLMKELDRVQKPEKKEEPKKEADPVAPNSDEPDKIVVSDERQPDYTEEEVKGVPPRLEKEPEIVIEKPKKDWKPKVTEKDGNVHFDFSDEPAGEITIPDLKATGFTKFTKKDLEMGDIEGPLQDAINSFNNEKQSILSEYEKNHSTADESRRKRQPDSKGLHSTPPKVDAGYQIINGQPFLRVNVSAVIGYYPKDVDLPSKLKRRKKSYIIQPDGTKTEIGQSWRDEIKAQREIYTKNSKKSSEDSRIITALNESSSYSRHKFFQNASYDPETNTIKAEVSTQKLAGDPDTKISANLTVPRYLHLLAHYNATQSGRFMGSGYVVPEKNLPGSVKEQIDIFREDTRAYGERISSSYYEAYLKGLETSFGEKNAKDTLKEEYGVKIKRQNGKEMDNEEVEMLKTVIDHTYNSMGNPRVLRKFAEERNLKISFSGDKNAFLRKAVGLYVPTRSTVVVGPGMREVMPHEMTHFIDDVLGTMMGAEGKGRGYYASEMQNTDVGMITAEGRRSYTKDESVKGAYWGRSCEVFARMVEQYAAINDGKGDLYYTTSGYWTKENFDKLSPKILSVLKERLGKSFSGLFPQRKSKSITVKKK